MSSNLCNVTHAVDFVRENFADCKTLADPINVPVANILGVAAYESKYGGGDIAMRDNNYFSLRAPAPFQTGIDHAKGDRTVHMAVFNSFMDSAKSFVTKYKDVISGISDPLEFSNALVKAHFNSGRKEDGGTPHYAEKLAEVITAVKTRIAC